MLADDRVAAQTDTHCRFRSHDVNAPVPVCPSGKLVEERLGSRLASAPSISVRPMSRIVIWTLVALIALAGIAWAIREWSDLPSP